MSHSNSYDTAFRLCRVLKYHHRKFIENDNITIYPSSWDDKFFEIMVRDKYEPEGECPLDIKMLKDIINDCNIEGWSIVMYGMENNGEMSTPITIQFSEG